MADQALIVQVAGTSVTLDAPESAPFRYVSVHNFSAGGATVEVYAGQGTGGRKLFTVPANRLVGVPIREQEHITFLVPAGSPAPAAADQAICSTSTAHLPATAAQL